jgi:hypothetical protein
MLLNSLHPRDICAKFGPNGTVFLEKLKLKSCGQTGERQTMDKGRSEKLTGALSSGELETTSNTLILHIRGMHAK